MTIIIAVVCADSIVVASDSQVSASSLSSSKRMDGQKIYEVAFTNAKALLATSGSITFGQRAVELTQNDCASQPLIDQRQLAETAAKSAGEANRFMLSPYGGTTLSKDDIDRILSENNFSLLTANYFTSEGETLPFIYVIESIKQSPVKMENYAAVGCGAGVAEFLISWFDFSKMLAREAAVAAAFIIGEVKKADCYCGGPTQVRVLFPGGIMRIIEDMPMIEAEVEKGSRLYKSHWATSASEMIQEIAKNL